MAAPNPTGVNFVSRVKGYDWELDSKGNVWYSVARFGMYFQEKTGTQVPVKQNLPDSIFGDRVGVYVDQATDSVYVGGKGGHIWTGKNGNWHELPQIPLMRILRNEPPYTYITEVGDFQRDKQGRLIAITDSLAWWLDAANDQWKAISTFDKYSCGPYRSGLGGHGFLQYSAVDKNGTIWASEIGGSLTRINSDLTVDSVPCADSWAYRPFIGPSGDMFTGRTGMIQEFLRLPGPNFLGPITVPSIPSGEIRTMNGTLGMFEDSEGYVWIGQGDRILIWKDGVRLIMPALGAVVKFSLSKDSVFWAFSEYTNLLYRYSEKYSIPPEAVSGAKLNQAAHSKMQARIVTHGRMVQLICSGQAEYTITSLNGKTLQKSILQGSTDLEFQTGVWHIKLISENNQAISQLIVMP